MRQSSSNIANRTRLMAPNRALVALLAAGAAALNTPGRLQNNKLASRGAERWPSVDRRQLASGIAALAGALVAAPSNAVVYLDPSR